MKQLGRQQTLTESSWPVGTEKGIILRGQQINHFRKQNIPTACPNHFICRYLLKSKEVI